MITIDAKTIQTVIDKHAEAEANGNWKPVIELDYNINQICHMLDKIQYMSNTKASGVSELLLNVVEDMYDYIKD